MQGVFVHHAMFVFLPLCVSGILEYSDDTAMARCVVQSLLTRAGFDEQDMARRYTGRTLLTLIAPLQGFTVLWCLGK